MVKREAVNFGDGGSSPSESACMAHNAKRSSTQAFTLRISGFEFHMRYNMVRQHSEAVWRSPVTGEIVGSSPIRTAQGQFQKRNQPVSNERLMAV